MTEEQLNLIWKEVSAEIKQKISPAIFKTWFLKVRLLSLKPGVAELGVENYFSKLNIEKYTKTDLIESLSRHCSYDIQEIIFTVTGAEKTAKPELFSQPNKEEPFEIVTVKTRNINQEISREPDIASNLNPKYTFESFIVGNTNRLAYAVARKVAEKPGKAYNPLYLYGGVGLGKTHLMQAIGNEIIAREPQKKVVYVSCESFTNEYVASIQKKQDSFKKKYRNIDVFLVDDIQFMAGKDGTQEEFFHTFNALFQTDKQIVITSDKAPADIKNLEERLSSRFSSGMITDMQLPDIETRQAILQAKCESEGVKFEPAVLSFIANLIETNIRELEGALTTLIASYPNNPKPTQDQVKDALKNFTRHTPLKLSNLDLLVSIVCESYGVENKDIQGKCRQQEIVKPRQILMYLMKNELGMTFPSIGREIGGRDHTTAMHAIEKIEKEMKKSNELLEELKAIKSLYYARTK